MAKIVLLPTQTIEGFAYNGNFGAYYTFASPAPFILQQNHSYDIIWDNKTYTREAFSFIKEDVSYVGIGDRALIGEESTGELFGIVYDPKNNVINYFYITEGTSHTIGVEKSVTSNDFLIQNSTLSEIADAIRSKTSSMETIKVSNMAEEILNIPQPKLNPLVLSSTTTGTVYNTYNIQNPASNGDFATDMWIYSNGELLSSKTAPTKGSTTSITDVSLYDGIDGPQIIELSLTGEGFTESDKLSIETSLQGITITPSDIAHDYAYDAIKTGGTLNFNLNEKSIDLGDDYNDHLPINISVKMNNVEITDYIWNRDIGYGYPGTSTTQGYGGTTRCQHGSLSIPNVVGPLKIDIPISKNLQLDCPTLQVLENKNILVTPPSYTNAILIYLDNEEYQKIQGITLEEGGISGNNFGNRKKDFTDGYIFLMQTSQGTSTSKQEVSRIYITAVEETPITIKATYTKSSSQSTNNYLLLSNLDTALSTTSYSDNASSIKQSFSGKDSIVPTEISYTVPPGEHFIDVKLRVYSTSSTGQIVNIINFDKMCPEKEIQILDYNKHIIQAKSLANGDGQIDSELTSPLEIQIQPICSVANRKLTAKNILPMVNSLELYINDILVDTITENLTHNMEFNLINYPYYFENSKVYFKVIGEDFNISSNIVTTDLSLTDLTITNNGSVDLVINNILEETTSIEVYINDEMVETIEHDGSAVSTMTIDTSQYGTTNSEENAVYIKTYGVINQTSNTLNMYTTAQPIYGVSGLYSSTVALTRTDDAVGMTYTINSDGTVDSDFNDVFPWNEATVVTDANGNKFLQMPKMWFRVATTGSSYISTIAVSKIRGKTGNWYSVEPFCYGCYGGSVANSKLQSISGATRSNFRTYASNNGTNYHQLDLYHHTVMNFLWWIEFASKNSQSIMTGRVSSSGTTATTSLRPTGGTDTITTPSGYETAYKQMRFHYIEDYIGNLQQWIDGVYCNYYGSSYRDYVTANPNNFSETVSGKSMTSYYNSTYATRCIAAYGWDISKPFLCTPTYSVSNTSYNTYFCDVVNRSNYSGYNCVYTGASYGGNSTTQGISMYYASQNTANSYVGGRLMYAGVLEE